MNMNRKKRGNSLKPTKLQRTNRAKSAPNSPETQDKILWRPSLDIMYKDPLLFDCLFKYMQKAYNSENILFLLSVKKLQQTTNDKSANDTILSIYNTYIKPNARHQINLSYQCFQNILSKRDSFTEFDLETQHCMFNLCVTEIETLMITSILPSYYRSYMFQGTAAQSKYYSNYLLSQTKKSWSAHRMPELEHIEKMEIEDVSMAFTVCEPKPTRNKLHESITEISKDSCFDEYME